MSSCFISVNVYFNTAEFVSPPVILHTSVVNDSKTETTTTLFPTTTREDKTTAIVTGSIAMVITLLVLCVSGCLVFALRYRSRNRRIEQQNNNRARNGGHNENHSLNDKEDCYEECDRIHCADVYAEDVRAGPSSDCSTPEHENVGRGCIASLLRDNAQEINNSIEMKDYDDCHSSGSFEAAYYEPAYCNIEGHFMS